MCSVARHLSMTMLSADYQEAVTAMFLMIQLSLNERTRFSVCQRAIPAESCKAECQLMAEKLTELFHCMWIRRQSHKNSMMRTYTTRTNGKEIKPVTTIRTSLYRQLLGRYRLNRFNEHFDQTGLPQESQCEFRKDTGIKDMTFTARQLQKKCHNKTLRGPLHELCRPYQDT